MATSSEIRSSAKKKWKDFLVYLSSSYLSSTPTKFFPWFYRGTKESKSDSYSSKYNTINELIANSKEKIGYGYTLVFDIANTRLYGEQSKIREIRIDSPSDYAKLIGKENEYDNFLKAISQLKKYFLNNNYPLFLLEKWINQNLDFLTEKREEDYYKSIFLALDWFIRNRNSNLYIREIPLALHTKFIEENKKIILSLFAEITLLSENEYKTKSFEEILGLKKKPLLVRYRLNSVKYNRDEIAIPLFNFSRLDKEEDLSKIKRVFIIENEIVYLTFPLDEESLIIFGSGFQVKLLESANWLRNKELFYFGDIDEHGFEMLAMFRSVFPNTISFLMDDETYNSFTEYAVKGKEATTLYDVFLTEDERQFLSKLRKSENKNRLEQERIPLCYIKERLQLL